MKTLGGSARCILTLMIAGWGTAASNAAVVTGDAVEVGSNVVQPNGGVCDQVLLTNATATISADPGQVVRISFVDTDDDIVQVEFSGNGSLMLTLEGATGPAVAAKYNQPGVRYMKGHARIQISGSNATTNLSVFSVGALNAANPAIIRLGEVYDGVADLSEVEIRVDPGSQNGSVFGGLRLGNANLWAREGRTGVHAPNVHFDGPVVLGDLMAFDTAQPVLRFGGQSQFGSVLLTGGTLVQPNGRLVGVEYRFLIALRPATTSMGAAIPAGSQYRSYWHLTGPDGAALLWAVP